MCEPLLHIANKLLGRQLLNFEQLTPPEQELWNLFQTSDIYKFLTGKTDTLQEFENFLTFSAKPTVKTDTSKLNLNFQQPAPAPVQRTLLAPPSVTHFLRQRQKN